MGRKRGKIYTYQKGKLKAKSYSKVLTYTLPKTKRLRKKGGWKFCDKCKKWFPLGNYATLVSGKYWCGTCLIMEIGEKYGESLRRI